MISFQIKAEEIGRQLYQGGESQKWEYSIYKTEPVDETRVIYFFHGAGGSSSTWLDTFKNFRKEWSINGAPHPIVVAISFGPIWIFSPENALQPNHNDIFWKEVVPSIENQLPNTISRRDAIGQSMGGYNALKIAMQKPLFFQKLVLISPAIFNLSIYAEDREIYNYVKRTDTLSFLKRIKFFFLGTDVDSLGVTKILHSRQPYIHDHEAWEKDSVFRLGSNKINSTFPKLLVTCGDEDEFGLFEGSKLLVDIVNSKKGQAEFKLLNGKHMVRDDASVVSYLAEL